MNYSLELLQWAYLPVTLRKEKGAVCGHCWRSEANCDCEEKYSVETDEFLNIPIVNAKYA